MYWPLGAPRIYVSSRRRRKLAAEESATDEDEEQEAEVPEPIVGFRVSRNGTMFATISATDLNIWHSNVSLSSSKSAASD